MPLDSEPSSDDSETEAAKEPVSGPAAVAGARDVDHTAVAGARDADHPAVAGARDVDRTAAAGTRDVDRAAASAASARTSSLRRKWGTSAMRDSTLSILNAMATEGDTEDEETDAATEVRIELKRSFPAFSLIKFLCRQAW